MLYKQAVAVCHRRRTVPRPGPDSHSLGHLYARKRTGHNSGKEGTNERDAGSGEK
jgi:hypothetical protein